MRPHSHTKVSVPLLRYNKSSLPPAGSSRHERLTGSLRKAKLRWPKATQRIRLGFEECPRGTMPQSAAKRKGLRVTPGRPSLQMVSTVGSLLKPSVCAALGKKMKSSNSSSGGIQGDIGQARDRNGNEQVRPPFESASQTRY